MDHGAVTVEFPQTQAPQASARVLGWLSVVFAVILTVMSIVNLFWLPTIRAMALSMVSWLMFVPVISVYLVLRSGARKRLAYEFTARGVGQSDFGMASTYLTWREAGSLYMARNLGAIQSQPFPVMVALQRAGQKTPTVWSDMPVWIQPGESATPELERAVTELVRRASAQIVDPEVILFLSAVRRALGSHGADGTPPAVPWMDASARTSFAREPATAIVPAVLDYFNGRVDAALARADTVISRHGEWDAFLCAALCHRALGDDGAYRRKLAASAASAPAEFASVLSTAAGNN